MNVLIRNYYRLLRNGAFGHNEPMEPMSQYKWHKVMLMAQNDGVVHLLADGNKEIGNAAGSPPLTTTDALRPANVNHTPIGESSFIRGWRLRRITNRERHSIDCSVATLELLDILMHNIEQTICRHTSLRTIIDMGLFLRTQGDKVDYIKLERWLRTLHVRRMATLHAGTLVAVMGFQLSELPFISRYDPWAERLIVADHRLTAAYLFRYPSATIHSWLKALWRVVTQIEE